MPAAISVKNLSKTYRTHRRGEGLREATKSLFSREHKITEALKSVSFEVKEGEIVGFIGPNGAGKSTAIKAMCGLLYPTSGKINVLDFDPWEQRVEYMQYVGVVFGQKTQLHWDLPPLDTYALNKVIYNIPDKVFKERLDELVELLDVAEIVRTPVRDLSLGERMKCELIAALLHAPKIVFLDEPTVGIDIVSKDKIRDFIKRINRQRKTTFLVTTHDMGDIEELCKRIIIINHGKIVYDGALSRVKRKYILSKRIQVKFRAPFDKINLADCTVISESKYQAVLEVSTRKQAIDKVVEYLLNKFSVADITISEPPIEAVIKEAFKE